MANRKADLPPIDDELAAPRKRLNLKSIRPASGVDDAAIEENSRKLGSEWGALTSLERGEAASPGAETVRAPIASVRIEMPEYLDRTLARKAADERVTKQYLVLKALEQAGYEIDPVDLVPDKRKARGRKA
jgi:hypothetical protein